jgi:SAM-dependent methyltransferase
VGDAAFLSRLFPNEPHHIDEYYREVERRLPPQGRVLDLGCGANTSLEGFRQPGLEIWGADLQAHPQLRHPEWFRLLGPSGAIPFANDTFDLVCCLWVLEHVQRPAVFLREVYRVLRPGGWLVAHSVNGQHYVAWIRRAFDLVPHAVVQRLVRRLYGRQEHDTFPTRYRLNTLPQLRREACRSGLTLEVLRRYSDLGWYFYFSPRLRRLAVWCDWLLEKTAPGWGRIYFTVCLRKPAAAVGAAALAAA